MSRSLCPAHEELRAFHVGTLSGDRSGVLIEHISTCPDCQAALETLGTAGDALLETLRSPAPPDPYEEESDCQAAVASIQAMAEAGFAAMARPPADAADIPAPAIPSRLGEYEIVEKLGEGGMGAVYKARHTRLDRMVALKVLPKERTASPDAVARFEREMKAVGRLSHANIVQAHDARDIEGTTVLVMEYVEGKDLSLLVKELGALPIADACELLRQAALGLQYAHEHGLVHRDIKPSNLMLTILPSPSGRGAGGEGAVKILDLGLALLHTEQTGGEEITAAGQVMGTADYLAPEQVTDSHQVDIRADIYSLGCTLYKLLSGRAPFGHLQGRGAMAKMLAHVQDPVPPIRSLRADVSEALAAVLGRMLAKAPAGRFATPGEVAEALSPFTAGANPAALLAAAQAGPGPSAATEALAPATDPAVSSAMTGTQPKPCAPMVGQEGQPQHAAPPEPLTKLRKPRNRVVALAAGAAAAMVLLGVVIWINRTRIEVPNGSLVTVNADGSVRVTTPATTDASGLPSPVSGAGPGVTNLPSPAPGEGPGVRAYKPGPPLPKPKGVPIQIAPEPLPLKPGDPLSKMALVTNPAPIPGVRSWTIETTAHRDRAASIAYSPDGRTLATGSFDGTIRLSDSATGKLTRILLGHNDSVFSIAWSPDGKYLATGGAHDPLHVWDAKSGLLVRRYPLPLCCEALAWSPNGHTIAIGGGDRNVRLWEVETEATPRVLGSETAVDGTQAIAWSPDGNRLATHTMFGMIGIWDVQSRALRHAIKGPVSGTGMNHTLVWSPDGKVVAVTGCGLFGVILWDAESGQPCGECKTDGGALCLGWSPDGTKIAVGDNVRWYLWDLETGKGTLRRCSSWPGERDFALAAAWSPDGTKLAFGSVRGSVLMYPMGNPLAANAVLGHAAFSSLRGGGDGCPTFSPKGSTLAFVDPEWALRVWDIASSWPPKPLHERCPDALFHPTWSQNGRFLAGWATWMAPVWNIESGSFRSCARFLAPSYNGPCRAIALSADAAVLALTWEDKTELWDATSGVMLRKLGGGGHSLAWSHDGKIVAVGGDKGVELRDPASGVILKTLAGANSPVLAIAWSPDGRWLAGGSGNVDPAAKSVFVWDARSGEIHRTFSNVVYGSCSLRWLSDGTTLIVASGRTVHVWDFESGELTRTIETFADDVSADGRFAAGGFGSAIRLCSLPDGCALCTLLCLRGGRFAVISPDGHYRGTPDVERELVYVVQTDQGPETLTPEEFSKRYGWKNDAGKVNLVIETKADGEKAKPHAESGERVAQTGVPQQPPHPPDDGKGRAKAEVAATSRPKPVEMKITPESRALKPGEPLSAMALVTNPAPIPGVRSWTVETEKLRAPVNSVACSPDGKLVATGEQNGTIRLWEASSGVLVGLLMGANAGFGFQSLDWSPDGGLLAAGAGHEIQLWDVHARKRVRTLDAGAGVTCVSWSPSGKSLAAGRWQAGACVWDVASGKIVRAFKRLEKPISALRWLPDDQRIVSVDVEATLHLWDVQGMAPLASVPHPEPLGECVNAWISLSPDGTRILTGKHACDAVLWRMEGGRPVRLKTFARPNSELARQYGFAPTVFLPDGGVVRTNMRTMEFWDADLAAKTFDVSVPHLHHCFAMPRDGKLLLVGGGSEGVSAIDLRSRSVAWRADRSSVFSVNGVQWSPDGTKILAQGYGYAYMWSTSSCQPCWSQGAGFVGRGATGGNHSGMAWFHDGNRIAMPAPDQKSVQIHDATSGEVLVSLRPATPLSAEDRVTRVAMSGDNSMVAAGLSNGKILVWKLGVEKPVQTIATNTGEVGVMAFSPDGKVLAAAGAFAFGVDMRSIRPALWEVSSGRLVHVLRTVPAGRDAYEADCLEFSPDGRHVAVVAYRDPSGAIRLYEVDSGKLVKTLECNEHTTGVQWLRDGKTLVSGARDHKLRWWDTQRGEPVRVTPAPWGGVLSPDETLVTGGNQFSSPYFLFNYTTDTVQLADARTGQVLRSLVSLPTPEGWKFLSVTAEGHYLSSPGFAKELVYVVETDQGQETITPEEFSKRYGWKNDPQKVQLVPPGSAKQTSSPVLQAK